MLVLGDDLAKSAAEAIAIFWLRDSMQPTIDPTLKQIQLLLPLLKLADKGLYDFLVSVDGLEPYFCVSWILTWLSHDLSHFQLVTRFFDFFLVSNPLMPLYVVAAGLSLRRQDIMQFDPDDFPIIHSYLSKFTVSMDAEAVIELALVYFQQYPPHKIQKHGEFLGRNSCVNMHTKEYMSTQLKEPLNKTLGYARAQQFSKDLAQKRMSLERMILYSSLVVLLLGLYWAVVFVQKED